MENTTAILGEKAHFFCQIQANIENLRFNGALYGPQYDPKDIKVNITRFNAEQDRLRVINITITITASILRNNTVIECITMNDRSIATLIVQGMCYSAT